MSLLNFLSSVFVTEWKERKYQGTVVHFFFALVRGQSNQSAEGFSSPLTVIPPLSPQKPR